jgi:ribosome-associated heat shock protein Hsp15
MAMNQESAAVRLDKWLWAARFYKTRALASTAIDLGRVRVEGERVKPARPARVGERIELLQGEQRIEVIVRALASLRGPAPVARGLYEETAASLLRREQAAQARRYGVEPARALRGRPTKRDRRQLEQG